MKDLKILIVENDNHIQDSLVDIVELLSHKVSGKAKNVVYAKTLLQRNPDLVLLDINLNGDENGFDFADFLNKQGIPFIFITAFADDETVQTAVSKDPFGYLVKPFGPEDVNTAIQVAMKTYITLSKKVDKDIIVNGKDRNIYLKVNSSLIKIREDEIFWAEARGDYVIFKTESNTYIVHSTMKNVMTKLSPSLFLKVHRSFIINLDKVVDITDSNLQIDNKIIPISRSNRNLLLEKINVL